MKHEWEHFFLSLLESLCTHCVNCFPRAQLKLWEKGKKKREIAFMLSCKDLHE